MANQKEGSLSAKQILLLGGALFSMHFGAACMLYPVTWGKESGSSVWLAFIGIFLSAVLIPLLGYIVLAKTGDSLLGIAKMIHPKFGVIFCIVLVVVNGPLYVIPRMSAAAWSAVCQLFRLNEGNLPAMIVFDIVYYLVAYWFLSSRSKTMDKLGKILTPVLLIIVAAVIFRGITDPISPVRAAKSFEQPAFVYGFLQGYATGDLLCSLMFGVVILTNLKGAGVKEKEFGSALLKVGATGMGLLGLSHLGHMIVGANTGGTINLVLSALYTETVLILLGRVGATVFMIALLAASLSTAVGIGAGCAEFFNEFTGEKYDYNKILMIICAASFLVSCTGLTTIVQVIGPVLDLCYPAAMVMVMYFVLKKNYRESAGLRGTFWAMAAATVMAALHTIYVYNDMFGWNLTGFVSAYLKLPLASYNFAWLPAAVLAYAAGWLTGGASGFRKSQRQ